MVGCVPILRPLEIGYPSLDACLPACLGPDGVAWGEGVGVVNVWGILGASTSPLGHEVPGPLTCIAPWEMQSWVSAPVLPSGRCSPQLLFLPSTL